MAKFHASIYEWLFYALKENDFGNIKKIINENIHFLRPDMLKDVVSVSSETMNLDMMGFLMNLNIDGLKNMCLSKTAISGNVFVMKYLIENFQDSMETSKFVFHDAISFGKLEMVEFLINNGFGSDCPNDNRLYPMHCAVASLDARIVKLLIEKRFSINAQDAIGLTPISCAINRNNIEIASLLLLYGSRVNSYFGSISSWHVANALERFEFFELFSKNGHFYPDCYISKLEKYSKIYNFI